MVLLKIFNADHMMFEKIPATAIFVDGYSSAAAVAKEVAGLGK